MLPLVSLTRSAALCYTNACMLTTVVLANPFHRIACLVLEEFAVRCEQRLTAH